MAESETALLEQWLADAKVFAKEAGLLIRNGVNKEDLQVENKMTCDFVTEIDKASEECVISKIREKYPEHRIIGEESGFLDASSKFTDDPTWVIDPLDGTTNFVHGYRQVCVCIGICVDKVPVVGVVYDVFSESMYSGAKGLGAFQDNQKLQVKQVKEVNN